MRARCCFGRCRDGTSLVKAESNQAIGVEGGRSQRGSENAVPREEDAAGVAMPSISKSLPSKSLELIQNIVFAL